MSREIKFRAWNTYSKQWVVLHGVKTMNCWEVFNDRVTLLQGNDWVWQQYTGLKDTNDTEVYEGDIVEIDGGAWIVRTVVEFSDGSFVFKQLSGAGRGTIVNGFDIRMNDRWKIEVVSNIYVYVNGGGTSAL